MASAMDGATENYETAKDGKAVDLRLRGRKHVVPQTVKLKHGVWCRKTTKGGEGYCIVCSKTINHSNNGSRAVL